MIDWEGGDRVSDKEVYALLGLENGLKLEYLQKLKAKAMKRAGGLEVHRFYGHELEETRILGLLQSPSLFGDLPWIEVMMAEAIKKGELKGLINFIKKGVGSGYLIFISDEERLDKSLEAVVPSAQKKVFKALSEEELEAFVHSYLAQRSGKIEEEALHLLLSRLLSDSQAIKRTLDFLLQGQSDLPEPMITLNAVRDFVEQTKEITVHDLFFSLAKRNLPEALDQVEQLMHSKDGLSVMTLIVLNRSFKGVIDYNALVANGYSGQQALKELKIFYQRAQSTQLAHKFYTDEELDAIMVFASQYDLAARDSNKEIIRQVIVSYVVSCCTAPFSLYDTLSPS
ncbi:DNA polymerase III subunit delta [Entomospira culicis]|uniref:DNA polymerase III subunit delta n=1 Tax=Entomospira culicis TaxID=2719989 RepID=A0A968KU33_9SPIO|nr:hypothetical protein [Entomospira culicis]NIZ18534.1 hypothetical protein [Entomospira culicis]NIZ68750.1 hypothetical protein [Entomospira culicis]WDI37346.1 hypothetical protein PVA46_00730 [Entomospira culicis]WDI38975.1 hypothetical protein PVA47_00740 [Entomospira culicis]